MSQFATKIAEKYSPLIVQQLRKFSWWAIPAAATAGWMVYPALTPNFKNSIGL